MAELQKLTNKFGNKPDCAKQIKYDATTQNVRIKKPTYEKLKSYKDNAGLTYDEIINKFLTDK